MRNLLMVLSGLFYINSVVAQATYLEEKNYAYKRLNSLRMRDFILLRIERLDTGDRLTYEIDVRDGALKTKNTARSKPMPKELSLTCTGTSFNILFDFMNPLKYSYEFKEDYTEDPSKVALEQFYNSLLNLTKQVTTNAEKGIVQSIDIAESIKGHYEFFESKSQNIITNLGNQGGGTNKDFEDLKQFRSDELLDWAIWNLEYAKRKVSAQKGRSKDENTISDKNTELISTMKKHMISTEKYLYESVPKEHIPQGLLIKRSRLYYEIYVLELLRILGETISAEEYERIKERVNTACVLLKEYNDSAEISCKAMEDITLVNTNAEQSFFNEYTQGKKTVYLQRVRSVISQRNEQIKKLMELISYVSEVYENKMSSPNAAKLHVVRIEPGKIASVNIIIRENNFKVEDGKVKNLGGRAFNCVLKASEYTTFVAEFGLGLAYTNLLYQKYSTNTSNGITTVVGDGYDRTNFVPFTALNLIPNMGRGSIYWMLQCGVGASNSRPIIATGTGFRVYGLGENFVRNFSITLGTLWTFTKELNQLSIGQQVKDQKALDDDMKYVFRTIPKPYLGVQFNF